jgi:hypothetical protein
MLRCWLYGPVFMFANAVSVSFADADVNADHYAECVAEHVFESNHNIDANPELITVPNSLSYPNRNSEPVGNSIADGFEYADYNSDDFMQSALNTFSIVLRFICSVAEPDDLAVPDTKCFS